MRIPGKVDQVAIHSLGKGIPPPFQIIGPIKRPINPPITEAGKKSFLKMGIRPRKSVPRSSKALNTQKQYSNWVSIALDMAISPFIKIFSEKSSYCTEPIKICQLNQTPGGNFFLKNPIFFRSLIGVSGYTRISSGRFEGVPGEGPRRFVYRGDPVSVAEGRFKPYHGYAVSIPEGVLMPTGMGRSGFYPLLRAYGI
jgi:hypothetical protein